MAHWWLLISLFAATAAAQSDDDAERAQRAGTAAFNEGDYELAIRELQHAYDLRPEPALLLSLSRAHEEDRDFPMAIDFLERYLREAGEIENRPSLERRLARLREEGSIHDRQRVAPAPSSSDPMPAVPAIVFWVVGGVGLLSFGLFGSLAAGEYGALSHDCEHHCTATQVQALNAYDLIADISLPLGVVAAITGFVLWAVLPQQESETFARVVPWLTPQSGGLAIVGAL